MLSQCLELPEEENGCLEEIDDSDMEDSGEEACQDHIVKKSVIYPFIELVTYILRE